MKVSKDDARLLKSLLENQAFCEAIEHVAEEEIDTAAAAIRVSIRANSLVEAARADGGLTAYEDLLPRLRQYAKRAEAD